MHHKAVSEGTGEEVLGAGPAATLRAEAQVPRQQQHRQGAGIRLRPPSQAPVSVLPPRGSSFKLSAASFMCCGENGML